MKPLLETGSLCVAESPGVMWCYGGEARPGRIGFSHAWCLSLECLWPWPFLENLVLQLKSKMKLRSLRFAKKLFECNCAVSVCELPPIGSCWRVASGVGCSLAGGRFQPASAYVPFKAGAWVTVHGVLSTQARHMPGPPCSCRYLPSPSS